MRYRISCLMVVFFVVFIPNTYGQNTERGLTVAPDLKSWGNYHALIIGINSYKNWPKLRTAVEDATDFSQVLINKYGFQKENVTIRLDEDASRENIIQDLRNIASSMAKDDNLLIYYAGHGQLDDFTGDGYWIPAEGGLKQTWSWVPNSLLKSVLGSERLAAKNVIVIADSCYSGTMLRGGPSLLPLSDKKYTEKLIAAASNRSRQVISSGGVEPVADGGVDGHSLFAYYFIKALHENYREVIDLENLFHTRVWKPVTEIGNQRPNVGRLKTPMDDDGQFVLYNEAWVKEQQRKAKEIEAAKKEAESRDSMAAIQADRQRLELERQKLQMEKELFVQQEAMAKKAEAENLAAIKGEMQRLEFERQKIQLEKELAIQKQQLEIEKMQLQIEKQKTAERPEKAKHEVNNMTAAVSTAVAINKPTLPISATASPESGIVAKDSHYVKYSSGVVYDSETGLEWYVGPDEDTSWKEAKDWLNSLDIDGGQWRFPSIAELKSLYSKGLGRRNMSPLFKSSGSFVWSDKSHFDGASAGFYRYTYYFDGRGEEYESASSAENKIRVFAVRETRGHRN